jgi:1-acyl-sn-glycerol-3-phosphate acyltransferase
MHYTVFHTPGIRTFLRWFAKAYLRVFGWKVEGRVPDVPRCVMIAAPHTSNWDFPITMFIALALEAKVYWMGKDKIFRKPFGAVMRWLGGIPVDRSRTNNVVGQMVDVFAGHEELIVIIPPEGTRGQVTYWKTGFYHIAHGAGVPIILGYVDYLRKAGGIGPTVWPTGDIEADMSTIRSFYAGVTGKYPEKSGQAAVDPSRSRRAA